MSDKPMEFWIVRNPVTDEHVLHLVKPTWESIPLGFERIHVIERQALLLACEDLTKARAELAAFKDYFDDEEQYQTFGHLIRKNAALVEALRTIYPALSTNPDYRKIVDEALNIRKAADVERT